MNPSFSIPARFTVEMSARSKEVKKDALEYKNYFFLLTKNEVKKRSVNRGKQKESQSKQKKIQTHHSSYHGSYTVVVLVVLGTSGLS